jgi:hypothetical protein
MAEHEGKSHDRSKESETERAGTKRRHQPKYGQLQAPDEGMLAGLSLEEHAELLENAQSDIQRADLVMRLQQSHGNSYVQRLLSSRVVQAKLTINRPGDVYEREADSVANAVTQNLVSGVQRETTEDLGAEGVEEEEEELQTMPASHLQRQAEEEEELQMKPVSAIQRQAEEEEELQTKPVSQIQRQAEEEEEVQAKAGEGRIMPVPEAIETGIDANRSGGQPLPESVRASLEPQFGHDFSQVHIHTDAEADSLSQQLGARAFTTGGDIFFKSGEYNPKNPSGLKLLAHELTHTLQQGVINRIAGWWPKGHKLITELAADKLKDLYSERAKSYLAIHSPNLDLKWIGAYMRGKDATKKMKKAYQKLIESGNLKEAQQMYDANMLHVREADYQDQHGEAGHYKAAGASANEGVTARLLGDAVAKWKSGSKLDALSLLGDTLHQAEDRGSHGEGNPFEGHDERLKLYKQDWETNYKPTWKPDDVTINSKGAVLAQGFAENVLKKFHADIGLSPGKKVDISFWRRIPAFFRGKLSWKRITHIIGSTGLGSSEGREKLDAIIKTQLKDPTVAAAYEKARGNPEKQQAILEEYLKTNPEYKEVFERLAQEQRR